MRQKPASFPRLSGRLYFFPALLPLAELAPWLIAVLGAVTGAAGLTAAAQRHRRKIQVTMLLCFATALGAYLYARPDKIVRDTGTQLTPQTHLPSPTPAAGNAPKAPATQTEKFIQLWTRQTQKQILSTPVVANDKLIFGSYEGSVEALARKDGEALWSLPQSAYVFSLAFDGRVLYAGTGLHDNQSSTLTAIDPASGKALWQREFLGHLENPAAIDAAHNRLWQGAGPGGLWALNMKDGEVLWHADIGHIDSTPLLVGDTLYAPAEPKAQGYLYALKADSGSELWKSKIPGQPWGSPLLDKNGETIFISSSIGQIGVAKETDRGWTQALSRATGKILWQKQLPDMTIQPDIYLPEHNIIVYTLKNGGLIALNAATGAEVWHAPVGGEFQAAAALLPGAGIPLIAATTFDGVFTIRNAVTGEEVARRKIGFSASSSPVAVEDVVYVTAAHEVDAFTGISALRGAP